MRVGPGSAARRGKGTAGTRATPGGPLTPRFRGPAGWAHAGESLVPVRTGRDHGAGPVGRSWAGARRGIAGRRESNAPRASAAARVTGQRHGREDGCWGAASRRPGGARLSPASRPPPPALGAPTRGSSWPPPSPRGAGSRGSWREPRARRGRARGPLLFPQVPSRKSPPERPAQPAPPARRLQPGPGRGGGGLGPLRTRSGDGEAMLACDWREPSGGDRGWDLCLLTGEPDWGSRR